MISSWSWREDRQWATSRLMKDWSGAVSPPAVLAWHLEVRTEPENGCSQRLGEIVFTGSMSGTLTARLREEMV